MTTGDLPTFECAVALIVADSRVLLGHRSKDRPTYPDVWDLFGGHVEAGETLEAALVRELDEELAIRPTAYEQFTELAEPEAGPRARSSRIESIRDVNLALRQNLRDRFTTRIASMRDDRALGRKRYTIFKVTAWDGPGPRLTGDEHTEIAWFTPDEARNANLAHRVYRTLIADAVG